MPAQNWQELGAGSSADLSDHSLDCRAFPINWDARSHIELIAAPATSAVATERCFVLPLVRGAALWVSIRRLCHAKVGNTR